LQLFDLQLGELLFTILGSWLFFYILIIKASGERGRRRRLWGRRRGESCDLLMSLRRLRERGRRGARRRLRGGLRGGRGGGGGRGGRGRNRRGNRRRRT
jgi:hypothetical protein